MKKNLSVFVVLILLVTSLKYGSKAREMNHPIIPEQLKNRLVTAATAPSFDETLADMQVANSELANGNAEPFKALWSRAEDVTIFGESQEKELVGWPAIEAGLDAAGKASQKGTSYQFEKIASHEDDAQGYLVQKESYTFANGTTKEIQATILFRKEDGQWKIVHRHGDQLSSEHQLAHASNR